MQFKVEYCDLCQGTMVICPKCGNNCCNGAYGLMDKNGKALPWNTKEEDAVHCDVCSLAYQYQYLYWELDKFCICDKKCICEYVLDEHQFPPGEIIKHDKCPIHGKEGMKPEPNPECPVHRKEKECRKNKIS
jgi:hypothetical protein